MSSTSTHPHGEQLSAYIDSMLDVSRMRGIAEHLSVCAACCSLEAELRRTKHLVRGLPPPISPGPEFWTATYRQLRVDDRERSQTKRPLWQSLREPQQAAHRRWAGGLAAAAVAAGLLAGPLTPAPHLSAPATHLIAPSAPKVLVPAQDVSPDVSSLAALHTDSVSRLPLADPDRQKMIAADVQQGPPSSDASAADTSEAAGYADAPF